MGRSGHARVLPGSLIQDLGNILCAFFASTDLMECTDDGSAHLVEKSIAFHDDGDERTRCLEVAAKKRAHGIFTFVVLIGGQRSEIVFPDKTLGCLPHAVEIQLHRNMPCERAEKGIGSAVVPDLIAVLFALTVESRVESNGNSTSVNDADVIGKKGVQGQRDLSDRHVKLRLRNCHMSRHAQSVHTGIRPAGSVDSCDGRKETLESLFDSLLDGDAVFLSLPALVVSAVVGDRQFQFDRVLIGRFAPWIVLRICC